MTGGAARRTVVLFDIDGTLLLSSGAGRRAIVRTLRDHVRDTAAFQGVRFDGKTDPEIVVELLETDGQREARDSERVLDLCREYVAHLAHELEQPETRTTLMPGIPELLARLERDEGVLLGLLTGNVAEGAALKLRSAGLDPGRFPVGAYGSDAGYRTELPAIAAQRAARWFGRVPSGAEIVIIGDTPADVACGASVGARAVAVATGQYTVDQLEACAPHATFSDLTDTERVVEAIRGP